MKGFFFNDEFSTPDAIDRRRALINALAPKNLSADPVGHWTAGLARVLGAAADGYEGAKLNEAEKKGMEAWNKQYFTELQKQLAGNWGGTDTPSFAPPTPAPASVPRETAPPAPVPQQPLLENRPQMPVTSAQDGTPLPPQRPASPFGSLNQSITTNPTPLFVQDESGKDLRRGLPRIGTMPVDTSLGFQAPGAMTAMNMRPNTSLSNFEIANGKGGYRPMTPQEMETVKPGSNGTWSRMLTQESGNRQFRADGSPVTSPKGAIGIAQVMPGTGPEAAKLAGLPWDPVRFRNDPQYNEALGRAYYDAQNRTFRDPIAAAAAYNAGPGRVNQAIARQEQTGQPYTDFLPKETQGYIAAVGGADMPAQGAQAAEQPLARPGPGQFAMPSQAGQQRPTVNPALLQALSSPWAAKNPMLAQLGMKLVGDQLTGRQVTPVDLGDRIALLDKNGTPTGFLPKSRDAADWEIKTDPDGNPTGRFNKRTGEFLPITTAQPNQPKISRDIANREAEIRRRGLDPNDPTSQRYILTGQLPDPEIKADERKMIAEAEDQKIELSGTIESLRRARELAPQAYSGFGAGIRGTLGANLPGPGVIFDESRAKATTELGKLLSMEAIAAMSASLKGATTDNELKQFTNILADANASPELKMRTIDRMLRLAETKSATADDRIKGIRSKTYFQPQKATTPAQQQGQNPSPLIDEARKAIANGADPEKVKARLKERGIDPGAL